MKMLPMLYLGSLLYSMLLLSTECTTRGTSPSGDSVGYQTPPPAYESTMVECTVQSNPLASTEQCRTCEPFPALLTLAKIASTNSVDCPVHSPTPKKKARASFLTTGSAGDCPVASPSDCDALTEQQDDLSATFTKTQGCRECEPLTALLTLARLASTTSVDCSVHSPTPKKEQRTPFPRVASDCRVASPSDRGSAVLLSQVQNDSTSSWADVMVDFRDIIATPGSAVVKR